jgi:hypothetical protein
MYSVQVMLDNGIGCFLSPIDASKFLIRDNVSSLYTVFILLLILKK